jgi:hypothetical protein
VVSDGSREMQMDSGSMASPFKSASELGQAKVTRKSWKLIKLNHMRIKKTQIIGIIVLAATLGARAQTITWATAQNILGASDVVNTGTQLGTWAPGDASSESYPVNGVIFSPNTLTNFTSSGFGSTTSGAGSPGTASANYNALLGFIEYGGSYTDPMAAVASFSWGGMIAGDTYEVQLWVENTTPGYSFSQAEYVIGGTTYGTDMAGPLTILTATTGGVGQYITGTFVAGSGSETIGFAPTATQAGWSIPQINLFQVRDITASVPEPATVGLAAVGLAMGLALRRRRS